MKATERAAELGTQHGREAAEAWLAREVTPTDVTALACIEQDRLDLLALPVPDLSGEGDSPYCSPAELAYDCGRHDLGEPEDLNSPDMDALVAAYCSAFTAAVEATVREAASR